VCFYRLGLIYTRLRLETDVQEQRINRYRKEGPKCYSAHQGLEISLQGDWFLGLIVLLRMLCLGRREAIQSRLSLLRTAWQRPGPSSTLFGLEFTPQ